MGEILRRRAAALCAAASTRVDAALLVDYLVSVAYHHDRQKR